MAFVDNSIGLVSGIARVKTRVQVLVENLMHAPAGKRIEYNILNHIIECRANYRAGLLLLAL